MKKTILFDLDGTLTDSGEGIINCVIYALERFHLPIPPRESLRYFVGPPLHESFMKQGVPAERAEEAVAVDRERYVPTGMFENSPYSGVREMLEKLKDKYNSMLVYVSDHGESLGENNIYLHAAPYAIAPNEQTHVPLLVWFDDEFSDKFKLDIKCLKANLNKAYSHDNIFHSFLGIMGINTSAYNKELDIFAECKIVD